jgi:hypothetical protein
MFIKICLVAIAFTCLLGMNKVSSQDKRSPVISDLKVAPQAGPLGTIYKITLRITDPQGPGDIIKTLYHLREKVEGIQVPINDDGVNGDVSRGDGIYTGINFVPQSAEPKTHIFQVFVRDKAGNKSNVLEYRFTVLEDRAL